MEKELNALTTSEFFSMLKNQKLYSLKEELMDTVLIILMNIKIRV